jgi:hypothetical protein
LKSSKTARCFDSFEQWQARAEELECQFQRDGYIVVRAFIDPDEFPEWCRQAGLGVNRESRADFATEVAERKYGRNQS